MRAIPLIAVSLVLLLGYASLAVEIAEVKTEISVATDDETGAPVLRFTVWLEYNPVPPHFSFFTSWTTYTMADGTETLLQFEERPERDSPGVRLLFSSSPWIPIEPGKLYSAAFHFADTVHGLTFDRTFTYTAPTSLPIGIRLRQWDGSETIDLSGVPDEEIEELALYYQGLSDDYSVSSEEIALEAFLDGLAGSADSFPVSIILVPTAGLQIRIGNPSRQGSLNIGQIAYLYILPDRDAIPGFRDQLAQFDREFSGLSFTNAGSNLVLGAKTVFVETIAWEVLEAAELELTSRSEGDEP